MFGLLFHCSVDSKIANHSGFTTFSQAPNYAAWREAEGCKVPGQDANLQAIDSLVLRAIKVSLSNHVKVDDAWYSASLWVNLITEVLQYDTRCQGITQFYLHTHAFIHEWHDPYLHSPFQPKMVLIYRPWKNRRPSWTTVNKGEVGSIWWWNS